MMADKVADRGKETIAAQEEKVYVAAAGSFMGKALVRVLPGAGLGRVLAPEDDLAMDAKGLAAFLRVERPGAVFLPAMESFYEAESAESIGRRAIAMANVLEQSLGAGVQRLVLLTNDGAGIGALGIRLCRAYREQHGVQYIVAMSDVLYGSDDAEEYEETALRVLRAMHRAKLDGSSELALPIAADARRDFLFVDDFAAAAIHLLRHYREGQPLRVTAGKPITLARLAKEAAAVVGYAGKVHLTGGRKSAKQASWPSYGKAEGGAKVAIAQGLRLLYRRYKEKAVRISACVIMRDAAADIADCLESVREAADEIIVVDTGSVDDSPGIARRFTDRLYVFPWRDDFAAAKNFALSKASGDWVVFIDADEFFSRETRGNLRMILAALWGTGMADILRVRRRNIDGSRVHEVEVSDMPDRIFRRAEGLCYHGAIHEVLDFADGRETRTMDIRAEDLLLCHTGYSPERLREKEERNFRILERMEREGKEQKLRDYYLAGMYFDRKDFAKAAQHAQRFIASGRRPSTGAFDTYRVWYRSLREMKDEEGFRKALAVAEKEFPRMPDVYAERGRMLLEEGKCAEALACFAKAEEYFRAFDENYPHEYRAFADDLPEMYRRMGTAYRKLGKAKEAARMEGKARAEEIANEERKRVDSV